MLKIKITDRGQAWLGWDRYTGGIWQTEWSAQSAPQSVQRLSRAVLRLLDAAGNVQKKLETMQVSGEFTQTGIANSLAALVADQVGPALYRLHRELAIAEATAKALKASVSDPKVDKSDFAGALLRMQIRQHIATLELPARVRTAINADPITLQAILEGPAFLIDLPADVMHQVQSSAYKAAAPESVNEIELLDGAIKAAKSLQGIIAPAVQKTLNMTPQKTKELLSKNIEAELQQIDKDRSREAADPSAVLAMLPNLNKDALETIRARSTEVWLSKLGGGSTAA